MTPSLPPHPLKPHIFAMRKWGRQITGTQVDKSLALKTKNGGQTTNSRVYICIYIYMRCRVIIWAKFGVFHSYYLGQVCFCLNTVCKNTIKIGVSALIKNKKCAQKFAGLLSGPSWPFLCCNKLGPDNNPNLAQIITLQNGHFFLFLLLKMCWNTYFTVFFEHQPKCGQKKGKNDNFSHFSKHRLLKNRFVATPLLTKIGVFQLVFFETKNIDV